MFNFKEYYLLLKEAKNCQILENIIANFKIFVFKFGGFVFLFLICNPKIKKRKQANLAFGGDF